MDSKIQEKIETTCKEYVEEMVAAGAWCAHAYASSYLSEIYEAFKEIITPLKEVKGYDWKVAVNMFYDYEGMTTKIYQADNLTSDEKSIIADMINDEYLSILGAMAELIALYYKNETGKDLLEQVKQAEEE